MPKNNNNLVQRIVLGFFFVGLLIAIRGFENQLFYDPFLLYYKSDYTFQPFPKVAYLKLFFGLFMRYTLNSILSLAIIYQLFREIDFIKFAGVLYFSFFVVLIIALYFTLTLEGDTTAFLFFYIRRFLIQPLFLLLFVPAFFYQNRIK
jgi:exosortase F-associated protein